MATAKVKLSVCMPVYNSSKYISKSIESVLAQTYKDFYLNIFDNRSTDDTEEIVKSFKDPRIKYFKNETNLGLVGNHKRCLDSCETEYVNIWHDDDIMMPDNLEKKISVLDNNSNVGIVFSNVDFIDENDNLHSYEWNKECKNDFIIKGKDLFKKFVLKMHIGAFFFIGSALCRKDVIRQAGGFNLQDPPLTCDSSLWLRSLLISDAACIGKPLVKYRSYDSNSGGDFRTVEFLIKHFDIVDKTLKEYKNMIGDVELLTKEVENNFISQAGRRGIAACGRNDFQLAQKYVKWAEKFQGKNVWNKSLLSLRIRLMLGSKGLKIYKPIKKILRRN